MKIIVTCGLCDATKELTRDHHRYTFSDSGMNEYLLKEGWQRVDVTDYDTMDSIYFCPIHAVKIRDIAKRDSNE